MEVLVNGRPVSEYFKETKSFIEARQGTEYTLRFRNNSWKRVMAVFVVDGVEVIKGKSGAEADTGYIVDPWSSIEVKGYRINDSEVASFKFSSNAQSYTSLVGVKEVNPVTQEVTYKKDTKNNGVIAVRVYDEKVEPRDYKKTGPLRGPLISGWSNPNVHRGSFLYSGCPPQGNVSTGCANSWTITSTTTLSCGGSVVGGSVMDCLTEGPVASATYNCSVGPDMANVTKSATRRSLIPNFEKPNFDVGTTWGTKQQDKVREVNFVKADTYVDIEIYYASRESLAQYGIDFSNTKQIFGWPKAFEDKKQYCKVPEGYQG